MGGYNLTFSGTGNVGIGTTSPAQKLHVEGQCVEENSLIQVQSSKFKVQSEYKKVKDIKPGDEVLSLNEETGKFQYQNVEKTLDMGYKTIYELTTETGKRIETTGNHPYLVRTREHSDNNKTQKNSNQNQGGRNLSSIDKGPEIIDVHFDNLSKTTPNAMNKIANNNDFVKNNKLFVEAAGETKTKPIQAAAKLPQTPDKTRSSEKTSFPESVNPIFSNISTDSSLVNPSKFEKFSRVNGTWVKVVYLKEGDEIATVDGFEKITSIKVLPAKHVYDLQITNTHNFVANGIVAHNTYISGNTGIGTTAPANKLDVSGTTQMTGFKLTTSPVAGYALVSDANGVG
ncbi:hypothetical protein COZ39_04905, partial [Candidatus Roizmanbacteria bacterium CG_4_10_14_3_um_filter_33_21]